MRQALTLWTEALLKEHDWNEQLGVGLVYYGPILGWSAARGLPAGAT